MSRQKSRRYRGSGCRDSCCVYAGTEVEDSDICMTACLDDYEGSPIQWMMEQRQKLRAEIDSEIIYPKISRKEASKSGWVKEQK